MGCYEWDIPNMYKIAYMFKKKKEGNNTSFLGEGIFYFLRG